MKKAPEILISLVRVYGFALVVISESFSVEAAAVISLACDSIETAHISIPPSLSYMLSSNIYTSIVDNLRPMADILDF